jgi:hypothetical protein
MARRSPPRKVTYFEPVPPRLGRNTILKKDVMRRDLGAYRQMDGVDEETEGPVTRVERSHERGPVEL